MGETGFSSIQSVRVPGQVPSGWVDPGGPSRPGIIRATQENPVPFGMNLSNPGQPSRKTTARPIFRGRCAKLSKRDVKLTTARRSSCSGTSRAASFPSDKSA
jgi:hypothetical protein